MHRGQVYLQVVWYCSRIGRYVYVQCARVILIRLASFKFFMRMHATVTVTAYTQMNMPTYAHLTSAMQALFIHILQAARGPMRISVLHYVHTQPAASYLHVTNRQTCMASHRSRFTIHADVMSGALRRSFRLQMGLLQKCSLRMNTYLRAGIS